MKNFSIVFFSNKFLNYPNIKIYLIIQDFFKIYLVIKHFHLDILSFKYFLLKYIFKTELIK